MARTRTLLVASVVETVTRMGARKSPRLWIVTRGAAQFDAGESVTLAQTGLRGIARVLTFEHSELNTTLVDIEPDGTGSLAALAEELLAGSEATRSPCATVNAMSTGWCPHPPRPVVISPPKLATRW